MNKFDELYESIIEEGTDLPWVINSKVRKDGFMVKGVAPKDLSADEKATITDELYKNLSSINFFDDGTKLKQPTWEFYCKNTKKNEKFLKAFYDKHSDWDWKFERNQ